jgi:hypothetical protein
LLDSLELGLPEFGVYYKLSIIINGRRWLNWQVLWGLLEFLIGSIFFLVLSLVIRGTDLAGKNLPL